MTKCGFYSTHWA